MRGMNMRVFIPSFVPNMLTAWLPIETPVAAGSSCVSCAIRGEIKEICEEVRSVERNTKKKDTKKKNTDTTAYLEAGCLIIYLVNLINCLMIMYYRSGL